MIPTLIVFFPQMNHMWNRNHVFLSLLTLVKQAHMVNNNIWIQTKTQNPLMPQTLCFCISFSLIRMVFYNWNLLIYKLWGLWEIQMRWGGWRCGWFHPWPSCPPSEAPWGCWRRFGLQRTRTVSQDPAGLHVWEERTCRRGSERRSAWSFHHWMQTARRWLNRTPPSLDPRSADHQGLPGRW